MTANQQELPGSNKGAVYVLLTSPSSTQRLQTASAYLLLRPTLHPVLKPRQIFSIPLFFLSSIAASKINRICKLYCFLPYASSIVNKMSELEEYV